MKRRKLIGLLSLLIPSAFVLRSASIACAGLTPSKDSADRSPQGEAIALVMEIHRTKLAEAEFKHFEERGTDWFRGGNKQYWWHDTITRTWSAWRPFAPGVIDSTHFFVVAYSIGDTEVGRWSVDTRKRTAQLLAKGAVM